MSFLFRYVLVSIFVLSQKKVSDRKVGSLDKKLIRKVAETALTKTAILILVGSEVDRFENTWKCESVGFHFFILLL